MTKRYVFKFYRGEQLIWLFTMESDNPVKDCPRLLRAYNKENEWHEKERATTVNYLEMNNWLEVLNNRGKQYKSLIRGKR